MHGNTFKDAIGWGVIVQRMDSTDLFRWRKKNGFEPTDESKWPEFKIPEDAIIIAGQHLRQYAPINCFAERADAERNAEKLQAENWQKNSRFHIRKCKGFYVSPSKRYTDGKGKIVEVW